MAEPLKIHLGCGRHRMNDWVNCDLHPAPNVDRAFDVQKDWPFEDNAASAIYASHMLEHIADPHAFFREAWRVLHPNGGMVLRMPFGGHRAAWWDLTHVRPWFPETFAFLQPGYNDAIGNPQADDWRAYFGIHVIDLRVSGKFAKPLSRSRLFRKWFIAFAAHIPDAIEEIWARLYALKTPDAIELYRRDHIANYVPTQVCAYRHHLASEERTTGEVGELVPLAEGGVVNGFHAWRW